MTTITAPRSSRLLTPGEIELARSVYGDAIKLEGVEVRRRKWAFFQPRGTVMAPRGHIHFHHQASNWTEDFSTAPIDQRGLFVHELCHVWQHQRGIFLPLVRHPFCRYHYSFVPGWTLQRYGIEQQAEIVRHAYLMALGVQIVGAPDLSRYEQLLQPFQ